MGELRMNMSKMVKIMRAYFLIVAITIIFFSLVPFISSFLSNYISVIDDFLSNLYAYLIILIISFTYYLLPFILIGIVFMKIFSKHKKQAITESGLVIKSSKRYWIIITIGIIILVLLSI
jgi:hypothetical protein